MLPKPRLGFVLVGGVSEAEVILDRLGVEGTKQIRPYAVGPFQSASAHFIFCGQSHRGSHLRGDRNIGEDHPAHV